MVCRLRSRPLTRRRLRPRLWASCGIAAVIAIETAVSLATNVGGFGFSSTADQGRLALVDVPRDAATLQQADALVRPGGTILISPGTYRESALIDKPRVIVRGLDRNRVVFDGGWRLDDGITVTAPGVSVENLTVRDYNLNGVLVTGETDADGQGVGRGSDGYEPQDPSKYPPLDGFRVRYVTSYDNGLYGIYAFDAHDGVIEHTYTSGGADSGLYVGQCVPCDVVVRDNIAERNAVGLEADNASMHMYVLGNRLTGNRVGVAIGSNYQEALIPQRSATVIGNLVAHNDDPDTPEQADGGFGIGIGIDGGNANLVARNRVVDNPTVGLVIESHEDLAPTGNTVAGNVFATNGLDVGYAASERAPGSGDCIRPDNVLRRTLPTLPSFDGCLNGPGADITQPAAPPGVSFHAIPAPPAQPDLPPGTPYTAAVGLPGVVNPDTVALPAPNLLSEGSVVTP